MLVWIFHQIFEAFSEYMNFRNVLTIALASVWCQKHDTMCLELRAIGTRRGQIASLPDFGRKRNKICMLRGICFCIVTSFINFCNFRNVLTNALASIWCQKRDTIQRLLSSIKKSLHYAKIEKVLGFLPSPKH